LVQDGILYVGGRTNRAQVAFERELLTLLETLPAPKTLTLKDPEALTLNPSPKMGEGL